MKHKLLVWSLCTLTLILSIFSLTRTSAAKSPVIYEPRFEGIPADTILSRYSGLPRRNFTLAELDMHPDRLYPTYFGRSGTPFQKLLETFITRQGQDDNFTVRWQIKSTGQSETVVLDSLKQIYNQRGFMDWDAVDQERRKISTRIKTDFRTRGIPESDYDVRWGRKNQVLEARKRDEPYILYELRLARQMGLSTLATEIGTVETFNQDHLVSSVGARGRYQFMPAVLRTFNINRYKLKNRANTQLQIREEYHPLLTMEPSITWIKGYTNAVGHEIPGISSYHTGPGNVYKIFEYYIDAGNKPTDVFEAFMWGVTDGFPTVSANSSFKGHSQGYVPSGYGAMKAVEDIPIDLDKIITCERVVLQNGASIFLSELLPQIQDLFKTQPAYEAFRKLNPHIPLTEEFGEISARNDVKFTRLAQGETVHLFLPIGSTARLPQLIDATETFAYHHTTFLEPKLTGEFTQADAEYEALIQDIGQFGYHQRNKDKLLDLANQFENLYNQYPTQYRKMQLKIIRVHKQVWSTDAWRNLARKVENAKGLPEQIIDRVRETFDF